MKKRQHRFMVARLKRRQNGSKEVVVPTGFAPWRLGQRIWVKASDGKIEISPTPRGSRGAGRHSRRVRRGIRSLLNDSLR